MRHGGSRAKVVRLIPVLDFGGVETTFVLEAEGIDRSRFDLRVCTFWKAGNAAQRIRDLGIPVDVLDVDPAIRNPRASIALARYLRREKPDVLHASIGEANFHAALVGRLCGVPVTLMEEQGLPSRGLFARLVHAGLYRLVDGVVGVSQASCDYLVQREWAPRICVKLLYNAAAAHFFTPVVARQAASNGFHFLTVGRLVDVKNHLRLIEAFRLVANQVENARLTIIGDGPLAGRLRDKVDELDLGGRVSLPGYQAGIKEAVEAADCFVLPSLSEGFGIAAVEAMARGVPVIVSDAGALPEITADMGREWIVPAADVRGWGEAMVRMARLEPAAHSSLRIRAREIAERFSAQAHVTALENYYVALLGQAR